jgi:hypothetical protein
MKRGAAVKQVAELIHSVALSHPTRVAVDGVDGAGKTRLAEELAAVLRSMGPCVYRGIYRRIPPTERRQVSSRPNFS